LARFLTDQSHYILENALRYDNHYSALVSVRICEINSSLLDLCDGDQLPTVCIKIRNHYPKYTNTPLSEVPNQLTFADTGSSNSFNMIRFKLLPSALVDTRAPHEFILHYCCENDEKLGLHLGITMGVSRQLDNPLLIESFDLKIEMRYIDENFAKLVMCPIQNLP
jgi:hypothetical protein